MTAEKLRTALKRRYFRTIDLFSGCGGMTLGFHRAGFRCVAAIEKNVHAQASHAANFAARGGHDEYRSYGDIVNVPPPAAVRHLSPLLPDPRTGIDVVIGGPPCQAFSRLGRAALWDLAGRKNAHGTDSRATLYEHFLEYVATLEPLAFVMENVREMGRFVGRNVAEEVAVTADALGYEVRYAILNAVWFGVPQLRERLFVVGIHKALRQNPRFPAIEYRCDLPIGYSTARAGRGHTQVLDPSDHFVDHADSRRRLKSAVTVSQALADLPPILHHLDGRTGRGQPRDPDAVAPYGPTMSSYARAMRRWPSFESGGVVAGHVIRYTPRDYEIFRRMPHGGMYPEALEVAEEIFLERLSEYESLHGQAIPEDGELWREIRSRTVPPYKVHRYPNKFRKMHPDQPARTVPAHIGKDSYSHIHFDSRQARGISLREAARLQSFPDGFVFKGSMNQRLVQIGNAVPPLLAYAIARCLASQLRGAAR